VACRAGGVAGRPRRADLALVAVGAQRDAGQLRALDLMRPVAGGAGDPGRVARHRLVAGAAVERRRLASGCDQRALVDRVAALAGGARAARHRVIRVAIAMAAGAGLDLARRVLRVAALALRVPARRPRQQPGAIGVAAGAGFRARGRRCVRRVAGIAAVVAGEGGAGRDARAR